MKKIIRIILLSAVFFSCLTGTLSAQEKDQYKEGIRELLITMDFDKQIQEMVNKISSQEEVPEELWDTVIKESANRLIDKLTEAFTPIYIEYFSLEEIRELIEFLSSPIGRKQAQCSSEISENLDKGTFFEWMIQSIEETFEDIEYYYHSEELSDPAENS